MKTRDQTQVPGWLPVTPTCAVLPVIRGLTKDGKTSKTLKTIGPNHVGRMLVQCINLERMQ